LAKDGSDGLSDRRADARIGEGVSRPRDPKRLCRPIVSGYSSFLDPSRLACFLCNEDWAEDCQVPVHQGCEILRHLSLVGPPAFCFSRFENDPRPLIKVTEALTQGQLSEVLMPDRMDSELSAPALALTRAAQAGNQPAAARINEPFQPLWDLFRRSGSFRMMYVMADALGFAEIGPEPLRPILSLSQEIYSRVEETLQILMS